MRLVLPTHVSSAESQGIHARNRIVLRSRMGKRTGSMHMPKEEDLHTRQPTKSASLDAGLSSPALCACPGCVCPKIAPCLAATRG